MPLYFAYGSNLDTQQMIESNGRCPNSKVLSHGYLPGFRLGFTRYSRLWGGGVADVILNPNGEVWGLVYELTEEDFDQLDNYEGYPEFYNRFQAQIICPDRFLPDVWVYEVIEKEDFVRPASKYIGIIKRAAEEFRFPKTYRDILNSIEVKN